MLVKEFKETQGYRFPEEFLDLIPETCINPDCNGATAMSEVLTSLTCTNPRCPSKITVRLLTMLRGIGVKGVGKETARDIVNKFSLDNPMLIFAYKFEEDGCLTDRLNESRSKSIQEQIALRKSFTLSEYVKVSNLPHIQGSADAIFGKFDSLYEAYEKIESGGVDYIAECLNIKKRTSDIDELVEKRTAEFINMLYELRDNVEYVKNYINTNEITIFKGYSNVADIYEILDSGDTVCIRNAVRDTLYSSNVEFLSIRALKVYETLMVFKQDLFNALEYVNILSVNNDDSGIKFLKVVCSTEVGGSFTSKQDFYTFINNKYKSKVHVDFLPSVVKSIDILIWAGGSNPSSNSTARVTSKVKQVREWNASYLDRKERDESLLKANEHFIPIMTASEFIDYIESI